jgi:hypothetical protein
VSARDVCFVPDLHHSSSRPFGPDDHERYLDGTPGDDGTRTILASRSIMVPEADADVVVEELGELVPRR